MIPNHQYKQFVAILEIDGLLTYLPKFFSLMRAEGKGSNKSEMVL